MWHYEIMEVSAFSSHIVNTFMKFKNIEIQGGICKGRGSVGNYSDVMFNANVVGICLSQSRRFTILHLVLTSIFRFTVGSYDRKIQSNQDMHTKRHLCNCWNKFVIVFAILNMGYENLFVERALNAERVRSQYFNRVSTIERARFWNARARWRIHAPKY